VDREQVWKSTLEFMLKKTPAEFTQLKIEVVFKNEEGFDAGK